MKFDLLFNKYLYEKPLVSSKALYDLNVIDFAEKLLGKNEDLKDIFCSVLSSPLNNSEDIEKRRQIINDYMRNPGSVDKMIRICDIARRIKPEERKTLYQKIDAIKRMQISYSVFISILECVDELGQTIKTYNFRSNELSELSRFFY